MINFIKNKLKKYLYNAPVFSLPVEWETVEEEVCEPEPEVVTLNPLEVIENTYYINGVWDISLNLVKELTDYGLSINLESIAPRKLNKVYVSVNNHTLEDLINRCDDCITAVLSHSNFTSKNIKVKLDPRPMVLTDFLIDNNNYSYSVRKALERINERASYFLNVIDREKDEQLREYYHIQSKPIAREFAHLAESLISLGV